MPKSVRDSKKAVAAPYKKGGKAANVQPKKSAVVHKQMNKKGMKFRNEALADQIDDLFTEVSNKKPQTKKKVVDHEKKAQEVEAAQKKYEELQTDMDDALAQITKL
ncbi:unnamed protein product [Umbelopsis ramanniana]